MDSWILDRTGCRGGRSLRFGLAGAAAVSLAVVSVAAAQGTTGRPAAPSGRESVEINFDARVGDRPFKCGERYDGVGTNKATILPQDFRLYVSEVRLLTASGAEVPLALTPDQFWQSDRVALLDFEDDTGNCLGNPRMNRVVRGTAPKDTYRGLIFTIGVPADLNHLDPTLAAAPLNVSDLFWPWRIGYKFTSIVFDSSQPLAGMRNMPGLASSNYALVLGSMDCGDGAWDAPPKVSCKSPNRPVVRLEAFDVATDRVTLDLAALFASTNLAIGPPNSSAPCWSFPENGACASIMRMIGLPFGGQPASPQMFVKKGPK